MLFAASAPRPPIQGRFRSRKQVSILEYSLAVSGPHRHAFVSALGIEIVHRPAGCPLGQGFSTGWRDLLCFCEKKS